MVIISSRRKPLTLRKIRSKAQKEARIIDLYENQDYTIQQICAEERVSATTASYITKKFNKSKEPLVASARSQALVLFKSKTPLVDVAAKLDLSADQIQNFYSEFQRLSGLDEYVMSNFKTAGDINNFLDVYKECQELGITAATAMEAVAMSKSLSELQTEREILAQELEYIRSTTTDAKAILNNLQKENEHLKSETELLQLHKNNLENDIFELKLAEQEYKNSEFHQTVREVATEVATRLLENKNFSRIEARVAILRVIRKNPELLPIICPAFQEYHNTNLERKFNALLEKSLEEGRLEFLMMVMPSTVSKLCTVIDELHGNYKNKESGTNW
jgi:hypothetical protein